MLIRWLRVFFLSTLLLLLSFLLVKSLLSLFNCEWKQLELWGSLSSIVALLAYALWWFDQKEKRTSDSGLQPMYLLAAIPPGIQGIDNAIAGRWPIAIITFMLTTFLILKSLPSRNKPEFVAQTENAGTKLKLRDGKLIDEWYAAALIGFLPAMIFALFVKIVLMDDVTNYPYSVLAGITWIVSSIYLYTGTLRATICSGTPPVLLLERTHFGRFPSTSIEKLEDILWIRTTVCGSGRAPQLCIVAVNRQYSDTTIVAFPYSKDKIPEIKNLGKQIAEFLMVENKDSLKID